MSVYMRIYMYLCVSAHTHACAQADNAPSPVHKNISEPAPPGPGLSPRTCCAQCPPCADSE